MSSKWQSTWRRQCVCKTVPLDDSGAARPSGTFEQLHQMLKETYPLVHQKLRREVINGYSRLHLAGGSARTWIR